MGAFFKLNPINCGDAIEDKEIILDVEIKQANNKTWEEIQRLAEINNLFGEVGTVMYTASTEQEVKDYLRRREIAQMDYNTGIRKRASIIFSQLSLRYGHLRRDTKKRMCCSSCQRKVSFDGE